MRAIRTVHTIWLPPLIALGPLLHGLLAMASPDLMQANEAWVNEALAVTQILIWSLALYAGFRVPDLVPGFNRADKLALLVLAAVAVHTTVLVAKDPVFSTMLLLMLLAPVLTALCLRKIIEVAGAGLSRQLVWALFLSMMLFLPCVFMLLASPPQAAEFDLAKGIPGYQNVRRWGFILAAATAIGCGLLLSLQSRGARWLLWTGLVILWAALSWSGTRGGILAVVAALIVMLVLAPPPARRNVLPLLSAMLAGAIISMMLPVPSADFGLMNAIGRAADVSASATPEVGRLALWRSALSTIGLNPWFGHGYAQNMWVTPFPIYYAQVHNSIIEVLLAWGFIGGFCAIFLAFKLWANALRLVRATTDPLRLAAFTLINTMALFSLVDGTLFYMDSLFVVAVAAAILFARYPSAATLPAGRPSYR